MNSIRFYGDGWDDYIYWQNQDKKTLKKLNKLFEDIARNGNKGLEHPEQLKGNLSEWWSRQIDEKNRLVYKIEDDTIIVLQCKNHYSDR